MSTSSARRIGRLGVVSLLLLAALAACRPPGGGGGGPSPDACHGGPDVEAVGGPEVNGTIATAVDASFGTLWSCNDDTNDDPSGFNDIDVFALPELTALGRLEVDCPDPATITSVEVALLDHTGAVLGGATCQASPADFAIAVLPGEHYVRVMQFATNVDAAVPVALTPVTDPADPLAVTLPQVVNGTVGPGDTTDTITFTSNGSQLRIRRGCQLPLTFDMTGQFGGVPGTAFPGSACGVAGDSTVTFDAGVVTIVVKAPAGVTEVRPYTFTFLNTA